MSARRTLARPPAASARSAVVLEALVEPSLAPMLLATAQRLGIELRLGDAHRPLAVVPDETFAHALRSEIVARVEGTIDLESGAGGRARRVLGPMVGKATSKSGAILREETDGRLTLHVRDRLPVDLGEPPEAAAALRAARARRVTPRKIADLQIPAGAEERARAITFGPARTLSDPSSRRVLEAFGIPAAPWRLAENAARAAAHARVLGYPIDLRVASPDVSAIDEPRYAAIELRTPGEVREGFRTIGREVRRLSPNARTLGVTVSKHFAGEPRLRLALAKSSLRVELDDAIGRKLTRPLLASAPSDTTSAAEMLACFAGRDALPELDSVAGRALLELIARFSRLALVLEDTLTFAEIAPLVRRGDGWVVLGTRLSVRGVELETHTRTPTGS